MGDFGNMSAGHVVFIPAVLLIGIVIGWILGSRAAADAYAADLRRREERRAAAAPPPANPPVNPPVNPPAR